jgi:hypothetical protein
MIYEISDPDEFKKLDKMTQDILLSEFEEDLIDEGFTEEEAKFQREMMEFELFN